jgi:hypothetical protein
LKRIPVEFTKIIELDDSIKYIRSVFADSLNMFQDINDEHDYIQFETGANSLESE